MISERRWHLSRNLQGEEQLTRQGMGAGYLRTEKGMDQGRGRKWLELEQWRTVWCARE